MPCLAVCLSLVSLRVYQIKNKDQSVRQKTGVTIFRDELHGRLNAVIRRRPVKSLHKEPSATYRDQAYHGAGGLQLMFIHI